MSIPTDASPSSQPEQQQQQQSQASQPQAQPTKRSSRRANTAERRATHNAVERLRRETLNGRFLDLAAMLPALAAQRRPSKSAIVNQSIALINNQRRSRIIAARELRLIKTENDALRQELNEWRGRNSLPRVEEPPRSADLIALLAVEEEAEGEEMMTMMMNSRRAAFDSMGGDEDDYNDDGDMDEQLSPDSAHPYHPGTVAIPTINHKVGGLPPVHHQQQQHQQQQHQQQQHQQQQAHYAQQAAVFEQQKAAMARAQMAAARASYPAHHQQMYAADTFFTTDMYGNTNGSEYPSTAQQQQAWSHKTAATQLATPPGTSHGQMKNEPSPYANTANSAFLSTSPYGSHQQHHSLGMFKPGSVGQARSEDGDSVGESAGSSHFSSVSDLGAALSNAGMMSSSPVDHTFAFGMGMPMQMQGMNGMQGMNMNMPTMMAMNNNGMGGMMSGMSMPSPPHSVSPAGSSPQSRRPSVNIPSASYAGSGNGSKHASPSPVPTPTPSQAQFVGMGLMM